MVGELIKSMFGGSILSNRPRIASQFLDNIATQWKAYNPNKPPVKKQTSPPAPRKIVDHNGNAGFDLPYIGETPAQASEKINAGYAAQQAEVSPTPPMREFTPARVKTSHFQPQLSTVKMD